MQLLKSIMLDKLILFALVVLVAHESGISNEACAMAYNLFFLARVDNSVVYAFGWPMIRPLFFFVGLYGFGAIAWQVLAS